MRGKEVCRTLKEIRAEIARQNGIPWETEECGFKGECRGACPRCEAEVRQLEEALAKRRRQRRRVTLRGIAAGFVSAWKRRWGADDEDAALEDLPDKEQRAGHGEMTLEELINDHQICGLITQVDAWDEDGGSVPDSREQEAERDRGD